MTGEHIRMSYRGDIDGLRALAVLAVLLFHAQISGFGGGFVGVDVFFVISGFLITKILIDNPSIVSFYERRARRILPALFALLVAAMALAGWMMLPHDLVALAKSAIAALLFSSNVWFWRQAGYFATETELWPLLHTWSLGVEEQFYIVFPLIVRLVRCWPKHWLAVIFALLAAASFATCVIAMSYYAKPVVAFYLAPTRAWELLIGSILATDAIPSIARPALRNLLAASGLAAIVSAVLFYTPATPFPGVGALLPVFGSAMVIWAGQGGESAIGSALGSRPLRFIGLVSYSLYLWHWPILAFARYVAVRPLTTAETAFALAASLIVATFSWRYIERPARHGPSDQAVLFVSFVSIVVLVGVGALVVHGHGYPRRFPATIVALNEQEGEDWRCPVTTMMPLGNFYACPIALPSRRATDAQVVLWGDSHAQMYGPALRAALGKRGALLINANGCAPVLGDAANPLCSTIQRSNYLQIVKLPAQTVVLAQNWPQYRDEASVRLRRTPRPEERYQDAIRRLIVLVNGLHAAGKRVVIVGPLALPGYNLASVAARDLAFHGRIKTRTGVTRAAYLAEYSNVLNAMEAMARQPGVSLVRVDEIACDIENCPFIQNGRAVFADHGHLTAQYAEGLTPLFIRALQ